MQGGLLSLLVVLGIIALIVAFVTGTGAQGAGTLSVAFALVGVLALGGAVATALPKRTRTTAGWALFAIIPIGALGWIALRGAF